MTDGDGAAMSFAAMHKNPPLRVTALAAVLLLAACSQKPEVIEQPDDMKADLATAKPVELPPALIASKTYRCKDNSVVYIDFFAGDKQANLRTAKDGTPTQLKAEQGGQPLVADGGYSLTGTATSSEITLAQPGKASQSCKA